MERLEVSESRAEVQETRVAELEAALEAKSQQLEDMVEGVLQDERAATREFLGEQEQRLQQAITVMSKHGPTEWIPLDEGQEFTLPVKGGEISLVDLGVAPNDWVRGFVVMEKNMGSISCGGVVAALGFMRSGGNHYTCPATSFTFRVDNDCSLVVTSPCNYSGPKLYVTITHVGRSLAIEGE